jgi:hypothetical protein
VSDPSAAAADAALLTRLYRGARQSVFNLVRSFSFDRYVGGLASVLLFSYTGVCVAALTYLRCVDAAGGRVVFSAPTIDCNSAAYKQYLVPVVLALIVLVVGFPLGALLLLARQRRFLLAVKRSVRERHNVSSIASSDSNLHEDGSQINNSTGHMDERSLLSLAERRFLTRFGPLMAMYSEHAWYWQALVLLRRATFAVVAVQLDQQSGLRFMLFTLMHAASLQLHHWVRPYDSAAAQNAETLSYLALLTLSVLLTACATPLSSAVQVVVILLVLVPAAFLLTWLVWSRRALLRPLVGAASKHPKLSSAAADKVCTSPSSRITHQSALHMAAVQPRSCAQPFSQTCTGDVELQAIDVSILPTAARTAARTSDDQEEVWTSREL